MKKFSIIIINILIILILAEMSCFIKKCITHYRVYTKNYSESYIKANNIKMLKHIIKIHLSEYFSLASCDNIKNFRPVFGKEYNNKSTAIFGCSYAYGLHLKDEETIGAILSKYTKNTVYNFALSGGSPREMLYLLREKNILNSVIRNKNIDHIVYVYLDQHKYRIHYGIGLYTPHFTYNKRTNTLKYKKPLIKIPSNALQLIKYGYARNMISEDKLNKMKNIYFTEINKEIKNYFSYQKKPPEFIILLYDDKYDKNEWTELEEQGIRIIRAEDLIKDINTNTEKYRLSDDKGHPNKKAWEDLVPKFADAVNF